MELNTRDLALLIVIGLLALYLWRQHSLGDMARSFARIFASRVLIEFTLLLVAWATMLVLIAERVGLWDSSLLHDTVLSLAPMGSLLFGATSAAKEDGWYRKRFRHAATLAVLVEVFAGSVTYDLWVEVILAIVLSFTAIVAALDGSRWDTTNGVAPRWARRITIVGAVIILAAPVLHLVQNWGTLDGGALARELFLPVWLTVLTLPLAWYVSFVTVHEDAQSRMRWWADYHPRWFQRLALLVWFNVRVRALNRFTYAVNAMHGFVRTQSLWEAWAYLRDWSPPAPIRDDDDEADWEMPPAAKPSSRRKRHKAHGHRRSR